MKIQDTPRLTLDLYPTDIETIKALTESEYKQLSFQIAMIPIDKEPKPPPPPSDELSKKISEVIKEYCLISGKDIKDIIEGLRETYKVDHLRSLADEAKQKILNFYQKKVDEIKIPEN